MSQFGDDFDADLADDFDVAEWLLNAPTEELILVLGNGMDSRLCWHRQLLRIRALDTAEVAPWA